ncbi:hypothetical protein B0H17DRAFT_1135754 [Mycena rosella]|uniref:Uncharacterized protein n=1 Tax=Mycena rosella TaxID=1033263 RepID=A0AAD7DFI0_MYCRO|nr:hypothetical protein B0H17DRAFT_1135754 [Mycena rosella]
MKRRVFEKMILGNLASTATTRDEADPSDWDFDLGNELPDIDCGDQCPDLDEEIISAPEISNEGELDAFTAFLRDAHAAAQRAEREREQSHKRPKTYFKNAPRTKRRHAKQAKDLKNKGFSNVFDYMKEMKRRKDEKELEESEPEHDNESSDSGEHLVDDHTPSNENESRDNISDSEEEPVTDRDHDTCFNEKTSFPTVAERLNNNAWTLLIWRTSGCVNCWRLLKMATFHLIPVPQAHQTRL